MPSLLQTLAPSKSKTSLYDQWGWSNPGGITLGVSETNPFRTAKDRLAAYRGWVYVVVSTIAADMAKQKPTLKDAGDEVVDEHPFLDLIRKPSPWYGPNVFKQMLQQHLDLAGEFFVYPERLGPRRPPTRLHVLAPDRVVIVPDPQEFIQGYLYTSWSGKTLAFDASEIIHVKYASPVDPYRGMSPVQALGFTPMINEAVNAYVFGYLRNDARPGGILTADGKIDEKTAQLLRQRWEEAHASFSRAGRIAILSNGAKYQQTGSTVSDINVRDLGEWGRDSVLAAYNVPAMKLGLATEYSFNNSEAAQNTYADTCLEPRTVLWQQDFYQPLVDMFGPGLSVEIPSPSQGNRDRLYKESLEDLRAGAITVRQHLERTGSPFAEGAPDVYILPANVTVMSQLGDTPPPAQPPRVLQGAIRAAAVAEYSDRKSGVHSRGRAVERWEGVLGSRAAAMALEEQLELAIARGGLVRAFEVLKGPGAKVIARELSQHAA